MTNQNCKTCVWEETTGLFVDGSQTKTAWAGVVGVSEASIRRHLSHSAVLQEAGDFVRQEADDLTSTIDVPDEFVTSRGMSLRDPITGSWHKVTWAPNKKALHDSLRYTDLADALDGWTPARRERTPVAPASVSVLNIADLQIGKANQRWGGTPETLASARRSVERFAAYVQNNGIDTAIVVDNGDPIENVFNVPSQLVTNDLSVPDQIRVFRRFILETIKTLAPLVRRLIYVAVPSNHGAARTGYKSPGGTVDADFGLEISSQVEDAVRENPHLGNVEFVRPLPLDETATLDTAQGKLAFYHGHQSKGVFGHGNWWKGMDHGRMAGWDADVLVVAHFHTQATYQSGDGRWVVACASSDPGSDWFTNRTGESAIRGMTAFDLVDRTPANVRIL